MRKIIVCADDAGWDEANDNVIARHALSGEISAVSVLVDGPTAADWGSIPLGQGCALGLHMNLTWSAENGSQGLARLIIGAFSGQLTDHELRAVLQAQLMRFETLYCRPPDFIDGHQHVQILPVVRKVLLDLLDQRYGSGTRPPVRVPSSRRSRGLKPALLNQLGARRFAQDVRERQWPANTDFAGAYDLSTRKEYRQRMQSWLQDIAAGGLIMAHPGSSDIKEHGAARASESEYFSGPYWKSDMEQANVCLVPFIESALIAAGVTSRQQ